MNDNSIRNREPGGRGRLPHITRPPHSTSHVSRVTHPARRLAAFTLIELLIVISIMAILAGMIFPTVGIVNRSKLRARARGELNQLIICINSYKAKMGHYPPDNAGMPGLNQLYYELAGTTNKGPGTVFGTLDGSAALLPAEITAFFGPNISGFVNSTKLGSDEAAPAQRFLAELKAGQAVDVNYFTSPGTTVKMLVCTVPGTDPNPSPLKDANNPSHPPITLVGAPWRYNSTNPTNNPNSFDLWVDILVSGKTNRISNWSTQPLIL